MSTSIAPLPTNTGFAISPDRHGRRDADAQSGNGGEGRETQAPPIPAAAPAPPAAASSAPMDEVEPVPAETLFAATLIGGALAETPGTAEMQALARQQWTPPESSLRLTDKLI